MQDAESLLLSDPPIWRPGSFTKNFAWGALDQGLKRLHDAIRVCFDGEIKPVAREQCILRLERAGYTWHIPLNFFLLNRVVEGVSLILPDELVYQAVTFEHSADFDKLALVAFNNSYVGYWAGADSWQRYPSPWAYHYVLANVAGSGGWDTSRISANAIQRFLTSDSRYRAADARKVSTNLNYMYLAGGLSQMAQPEVSRWWANALFLILDRSLDEFSQGNEELTQPLATQLVMRSGFLDVTGTRSRNKELAIQPLISLYLACGELGRLSGEATKQRQNVQLPDISYFANSDDPFYAIYPQDPNIIKALPRACAMLAKELAGFDELDANELTNWNVLEYVRRKTRDALQGLMGRGVRPTMTADDLLRLTRGQ